MELTLETSWIWLIVALKCAEWKKIRKSTAVARPWKVFSFTQSIFALGPFAKKSNATIFHCEKLSQCWHCRWVEQRPLWIFIRLSSESEHNENCYNKQFYNRLSISMPSYWQHVYFSSWNVNGLLINGKFGGFSSESLRLRKMRLFFLIMGKMKNWRRTM